MLKKLICFMALITFCAFSGCSESSQNENIELEDAPWGITMEDVFETYGVNKDTVENLIENKNDSYFALENGQEMFGEKTSQIYFSFVDASFSGKPQQLYEIRVVYPDDADMEQVLKKMKKDFGKTVPNISLYSLLSMAVSEYEEKENAEEYKRMWENFQQGLNAENWDEFSEKSHLTYGIYAGGKDAVPMFEKNGICLFAGNLILHNAIMEQLETEK
ncbi:MAG: hypothetical protein UCO29_11215 [Blautia hansenii]|nr:hypothetical protein [Blautia hansenii]MEE0657222.1 hypothetical protein [Blautia hansenii]